MLGSKAAKTPVVQLTLCYPEVSVIQVSQGESNGNDFDRMTEINRNLWRTPNSEEKKKSKPNYFPVNSFR